MLCLAAFLKSKVHNQRGQALVELAFSMVIFLVIALGTADMSRVLLRIHQLTQIAREGARVASVTPGVRNGGGGDALVLQKLGAVITNMGLDPATVTITITPLDLDGVAGTDAVTVTVTQPFTNGNGVVAFIPALARAAVTSSISMPYFIST